MPSLGDFFSDKVRLEHFESNLSVGTVFYLYAKFISRPKDKLFLLVRTEPAPLFFFISGQPVHPLLANQPELLKCQILLDTSDYRFLTKPSYINCTQLVAKLDLAEVKRQVLADTSRIRGPLSVDHLKAVRIAVHQDKATSPRVKTPVLAALDAAILARATH